MKRVAFVLVIATLFLLQACSSGTAAQQGMVPPELADQPYDTSLAGSANSASAAVVVPSLCSGGDDSNQASFAEEVIRLVNVERAKVKLAALTNQSQLEQAAQAHSVDMGCNFFMSHTGSDGSTPFDRIDYFGYVYSWAGENVAAGYTTPAAVMAGWMASKTHKANILNANFTEIGIGYVYNSGDTTNRYYHYWTMVLGKPQ
jgi:uncharacterized protein YkwD